MRISSISGVNYKINSYQKQNFKGLWGKTSINTDIEPTLGINTIFQTYYYYPFKSENVDHIDKTVNSQEYNDAKMSFDAYQPRYEIKECKQCSYLPFTEEQYQKYKNSKSVSEYNDEYRQIHSVVRNGRMFLDADNKEFAENIAFKDVQDSPNLEQISM